MAHTITIIISLTALGVCLLMGMMYLMTFDTIQVEARTVREVIMDVQARKQVSHQEFQSVVEEINTKVKGKRLKIDGQITPDKLLP